MKYLLGYNDIPFKTDWKTLYRRYRIGRLKHQYWLWNRKNKEKFLIDHYDHWILKNCQQGTTVFFDSSAYYLKDLFPEIIAAESHPVVKTFRPDVITVNRNQLYKSIPAADNFAVVNNRGDQWFTPVEMLTNMSHYTKVMRPGCRFFYSFRDTQIPKFNRLTIDQEKFWLDWAQGLEQSHNLKLVWHDIQFPKKYPDANGEYSTLENPDTTNGNLKFWFVYQGDPWNIIPYQ
jgi:hypothetical protein